MIDPAATPDNHTTESASGTAKLSGDVLSVVRDLLAEGRGDVVLDIMQRVLSENEQLKRLLAERKLHRNKGEGVSSAQLTLLLDALEQVAGGPDAEVDANVEQANEALRAVAADAAAAGEAKRRNKGKDRASRGRHPIPAHLEQIEQMREVPEPERACPKCGEERACIGHERNYTIELLPAKAVVIVEVVEKRACKDCEGELVRAPRESTKVVAGGKLGAGLVAQLLCDKYRDGLPLHRIKRRLAQLGLELPVSTLADQVTWSTDLLRPLWRAAAAMVLGAAVMQLDGTGLPVRDPHAGNRLKLGTLWGYLGDQTAVYLYTSTGKKTGQRPGELGPEEMLALRSGYTVADAAQLFDASFSREDLIECGCNMHARRYFKKALDAGDKRAALVLGAYKALYELEERIKDKQPAERLATRQAESEPIYDKIIAWCRAHQDAEPPSSPTGTAIRYVLNHQDALRRYLEHGAIPMDNGAVERLHIRVALTRKNFLFAGSDAGAERAAIAYTILACCALADVDPVAYLRDVLPRLARGIRLRDAPGLLPVAWKAAQSSLESA